MNSFYFFFIFTFILLFPINSNCFKTIHLKVLWSIFEENVNAYHLSKTSPQDRFRVHLFHHDETYALVSMSNLHTKRFDTYSVDVYDRVKFMDVEIRMGDAYGGDTVTIYKNLRYEKGKIIILPFHTTFSLPILSSAYHESIFSKPIRHLQFINIGKSIRPKSINCEAEEPGMMDSWISGYSFKNKNELKVQEVVCENNKYTFTFHLDDNKQSQTQKILMCDEPIYELGFVNRYEIVYDEKSEGVICSLQKNTDLDKHGQIDSSNTIPSQKPYLREFIERIVEIRTIYLLQKRDKMTPEAAFERVKAKEAGSAQQQQHVLLPLLGSVEQENIGHSGQHKRQKVHVGGIQGHAKHHHSEAEGSARQQPGLPELPFQPVHGHVGAGGSRSPQNIQTEHKGKEKQDLQDMPIHDQLDFYLKQGRAESGQQAQQQQQHVEAVQGAETLPNLELDYANVLMNIERELMMESDEE